MAKKTKAPAAPDADEPEEDFNEPEHGNPADDEDLDDPPGEVEDLDDDELEETDVSPAVDEPPPPAADHDTHYLDKLLALPGVPRNILKGLDPAAAWLTVQTRDMPAQAMPLGHLAPDALDTLADLGYERHARFELRPTAKSDQVRYFAAVLPDLPDDGDLDDDDDTEANGALLQLLRNQDARMTRLEELILKTAEGNADPFKQVERALNFVERITESVGSLRGSDGDAEIIKTVIEQLAPRFLPPPKD